MEEHLMEFLVFLFALPQANKFEARGVSKNTV